MLRALKNVSNDNPNGTGPKEEKDMSKEELVSLEKAREEDREFRANRAARTQRIDQLLELDDANNKASKKDK